MKNKNNISLVSIKLNKEIAFLLSHSKKIKSQGFDLWMKEHKDKQTIFYALLVTKNVFKLAVVRNKIKRIIRHALQLSTIPGGLSLLIKPNSNFDVIPFSNQLKKFEVNFYKRYVNF